MDSRTGLVTVDHDQFSLGHADADTLNVTAKGTLLEAGPGFVGVLTGIAYGPARVVVDVLTDVPDGSALESWEVIEQTALVSAEPIVVMTLDGAVVEDIVAVPAGAYTIRGHAVGRDTHTGLEVSEPIETYYFQLWPSPPPEVATVETLRKTDRAWNPRRSSHQPGTPIPKPDHDYVYVRSADGIVRKVDRYGDEAEAVRDWKKECGGRPLTPALKATIYARFVAALDRELLDRVETADEGTQLRFARWCAHRAFEKAGLVESEWLRELLHKMDEGTLTSEDLEGAKQRLDADPEMPVVLVTGLPGEPETVQQHQALLALGVTNLDKGSAFSDPFSPLKIAVWAYRHSLQSYGMDYVQLIDAAHRAFPPSQS